MKNQWASFAKYIFLSHFGHANWLKGRCNFCYVRYCISIFRLLLTLHDFWPKVEVKLIIAGYLRYHSCWFQNVTKVLWTTTFMWSRFQTICLSLQANSSTCKHKGLSRFQVTMAAQELMIVGAVLILLIKTHPRHLKSARNFHILWFQFWLWMIFDQWVCLFYEVWSSNT